MEITLEKHLNIKLPLFKRTCNCTMLFFFLKKSGIRKIHYFGGKMSIIFLVFYAFSTNVFHCNIFNEKIVPHFLGDKPI